MDKSQLIMEILRILEAMLDREKISYIRTDIEMLATLELDDIKLVHRIITQLYLK